MESKTKGESISKTEEDVDKDLQLIFKKLRVDCKPYVFKTFCFKRLK